MGCAVRSLPASVRAVPRARSFWLEILATDGARDYGPRILFFTTKLSLIAGVTRAADEIQSFGITFDATAIVAAFGAECEVPLVAFRTEPPTMSVDVTVV